MTTLLGIVALAAGCAHIVADYRRVWTATYVLKPLTMVAIIGVVLLPPGEYAGLRGWVIAGLCLSLAGDVLLMLRPARFFGGLTAFLLGHLAYCVGFVTTGAPLWWPAVLPVGLAGAVMARLLWPGLGRMRGPVVSYIAVIVLMVWLALSVWHNQGTPAAACLAAGAVLFMVSDAVLGYARFRHRFWSAQAITLCVYYLAQWLIAISTRVLSIATTAPV